MRKLKISNKGNKTRILSILLALVMMLSTVTVISTHFEVTISASTSAKVVFSQSELESALKNGEDIALWQDIHLTNEWMPIDNYSGTIDGNGYCIKNLYVSSSSNRQYAGLIGKSNGNITIKNLTLQLNSNGITANRAVAADTYSYAGAFLGAFSGESLIIEKCHVFGGNVTATSHRNYSTFTIISGGFKSFAFAGKMVGYAADSSSVTIKDSSAIGGNVTSNANVADFGPIVKAESFAGGFVGRTGSLYTFNNLYSEQSNIKAAYSGNIITGGTSNAGNFRGTGGDGTECYYISTQTLSASKKNSDGIAVSANPNIIPPSLARFSPTVDGYQFINWQYSFGYPDKYKIPLVRQLRRLLRQLRRLPRPRLRPLQPHLRLPQLHNRPPRPHQRPLRRVLSGK